MRIHITVEADPRRWRRPWRLMLLGIAALLTVAVPIALANHLFTDVDTSNGHHDNIAAIALAGVTNGCGPGLYCPGQNVTREQMASFLRRGFGRVGYDNLEVQTTGASMFTLSWTHQLTPGLPASALPNAAGFIKVDAVVVVENTNSDTACLVEVNVRVDGVLATNTYGAVLPVLSRNVFPLTGARSVTSSGPKDIEIRVVDVNSCGGVNAFGDATSSYFPFGSTGTNTLSGETNE